jgi:hypothetical protein
MASELEIRLQHMNGKEALYVSMGTPMKRCGQCVLRLDVLCKLGACILCKHAETKLCNVHGGQLRQDLTHRNLGVLVCACFANPECRSMEQ